MTINWRQLRPGHVLLAFLFSAGLYATVLRFAFGLGATTHLSDRFPWGLGSASTCCAA